MKINEDWSIVRKTVRVLPRNTYIYSLVQLSKKEKMEEDICTRCKREMNEERKRPDSG